MSTHPTARRNSIALSVGVAAFLVVLVAVGLGRATMQPEIRATDHRTQVVLRDLAEARKDLQETRTELFDTKNALSDALNDLVKTKVQLAQTRQRIHKHTLLWLLRRYDLQDARGVN